MGRRSRKAGRLDRPAPPPGLEREKARHASPQDAFARRAEEAERRNAEIRARLEPLAPDEHPLALKLAIATCIVLAISNLVFYLAGYELEEDGNALVPLLLFEGVLAVCAIGMYRHRYYAILGFQALLAITVVIAGLSIVVASNAWALLLCLAVIAYGGWLFWMMIRVMARIQMPDRARPR